MALKQTTKKLTRNAGTFVRTLRVATGSCPFRDDSGVVILAMNINGEYSLNGDSDVDPYTKIKVSFSISLLSYFSPFMDTHLIPQYVVKSFDTYLLKNNKELYYTTNNPGPCLYPTEVFNDDTLGCPCGGTWSDTAIYNTATEQFEGGR